MLKLVQFHPAFGSRNMSPYCLKLETYLRMTGIAHEVVWNSDTSKAPKGKLPYIIDGDQVMGDSVLIIDYLKEKHGDPLDGAQQSPVAHRMRYHMHGARVALRRKVDEEAHDIFFARLDRRLVHEFADDDLAHAGSART